jgi:hypothetical protein
MMDEEKPDQDGRDEQYQDVPPPHPAAEQHG